MLLVPQVREISSVISNDMQPLGNRRVLRRVAQLGTQGPPDKAAADAATTAWQHEFIGGGLAGAGRVLGCWP